MKTGEEIKREREWKGGTGIKGMGPGAWEWGQGYKTQVKSRENLGGKGIYIYLYDKGRMVRIGSIKTLCYC